jgi:hypothetical protein
MKRISLPNDPNLQGLQFSQADNRALMELLIGVTTGQITQADRTFANLLIMRYAYFLTELEREQVCQTEAPKHRHSPRPDLRQPPFAGRRKRKGGRR